MIVLSPVLDDCRQRQDRECIVSPSSLAKAITGVHSAFDLLILNRGFSFQITIKLFETFNDLDLLKSITKRLKCL